MSIKIKRQEEKIIKKNIVRILDWENRSCSIRETTLKLKEMGIKRSPQIVKRLLYELVDEKKIIEKEKF